VNSSINLRQAEHYCPSVAMMNEPRRSQRRKSSKGVLLIIVIIFVVFIFVNRRRFSHQKKQVIQENIRDDHLAELNKKEWGTDELLRWAIEKQFPAGDIVQVTSFGLSGLVLLHKLSILGLLHRVPILSVDTLHLFNETYRFIRKLQIQQTFPEMQLHMYKPKNHKTRTSFDTAYGTDLWQTNIEKYNALSKTEPFNRALNDFRARALITGRRRSQGGERTHLQPIEIDPTSSTRYKINPLYYWTYQDVWDYIHLHHIPYNPLHDAGYKSIGDFMTTKPVDKDAPERSGRFVGLNITECGIHKHNQEHHDEGKVAQLQCKRCLEVDSLDSLPNDHNIILEFYSPLCGGCRAFAPIFDHVVDRLPPTKFQAVRYDTLKNGIPTDAMDILGFQVKVTPSLFLIQNEPAFRVVQYRGKLQATSVLKWLADEVHEDFE